VILAMLIAIPLLAGLLSWPVSAVHRKAPFWLSLAAVGSDLLITAFIWANNSSNLVATRTNGQWLIDYRRDWMPQMGISIHLAIDGLSLILVGLTAFLAIAAIVSSWSEINERIAFFHANLMFTISGILGVFLTIDLFLFYFFWELMLVPMYFLISIWGHERRAYASMKFFIFTQAGGLLMLISILGIYFIHGKATGVYTFDYNQLIGFSLAQPETIWLMIGFVVAFAVKLPAVPLHPWLADAHTEAPTAGSIILAGLLLKTGAYGFLRFVIPMFPAASAMIATPVMIIGTLSILYGAALAFSQTDFKRMVAYTSISHMGFVLLGIFSFNELALQGTIAQIVAHGISTGMLFLIAGALQERLHTRDLTLMGGMWSTAPRMGAVTLIFAVASLGLPGTGNFVGEFLVLLGSWQANEAITAVATMGLIGATVYAVWLMHVTFFGSAEVDRKFPDLSFREMVVAGIMIAAIIAMGMYPSPLFKISGSSVQALTSEINTMRDASAAWHETHDTIKPGVTR